MTSKEKSSAEEIKYKQDLKPGSCPEAADLSDSTDIPTMGHLPDVCDNQLGIQQIDSSQENFSTTSKENSEEKDLEPEFDRGYAWVILAASTFISCFSWGANASFGVFLSNFMSSNTYPNARDVDFAFVGGLSFGIGLVASPIPSTLIKYYPYQYVILVGSFIQSGGLIGASFTTRIWQLYLTQGILQGLGISMVFIPANAALPQWFKKRRGIANGLFTAGSGMGGMMFSFLTQALINKFGIPWAQRIGGMMCLVACILAGFCIKSRNGLVKGGVRAPAKFYDRQLMKRPDLYLIVLWGSLTMIGYGVVLFTMSSYAVSIGLTHTQGAAVSASVSAGIIAGRPAMGLLMDVYGFINIGLASTFSTAILCLALWTNAKSYGVVILFSILAGLVVSSSSTGFAPIAASMVELELLVPMYSMSWIIIGSFGIFSEPIAIGLRFGNNYLYTQLFTGLIYILGGIMLVLARGMHVRNILRQRDEEASIGAVMVAVEKDSVVLEKAGQPDDKKSVSEPTPSEKAAKDAQQVYTEELTCKKVPSFFQCMFYKIRV